MGTALHIGIHIIMCITMSILLLLKMVTYMKAAIHLLYMLICSIHIRPKGKCRRKGHKALKQSPVVSEMTC